VRHLLYNRIIHPANVGKWRELERIAIQQETASETLRVENEHLQTELQDTTSVADWLVIGSMKTVRGRKALDEIGGPFRSHLLFSVCW